MNLEVVSDDRYHPSEASAKVSSRFNIRNPVKTPPVLQVSSWSFGGHWGSLWTWRRCQMIGIILQKLLWKLHHYPSSETLSRLHLSSKSLPGVLEDMEVPDKPGVGVRCYGLTFRSFCESFIKIQYQKPCQDSTCPPSLFLESWRTWWFLMNLEVV